MKIIKVKKKATTTIDTSDCGVGEIIKGKEKTLNVVLEGAEQKKFSDRIRASC